MVCYGCFAFFLLLGGLLDAMAGYYPLDTDHIIRSGFREAMLSYVCSRCTHCLIV